VCLKGAAAGTPDQEFRLGLSAFDAGNYGTALRLWGALAAAEEPRAQAGLGFMYHRGLGVPLDDGQAAYWLTKAAEHGQADAQLTLGTLYFYGKGVPQSYIQAYAWCDLAQTGGAADASLCRDAALQSLPTEEDMRTAFKLSLDLRERSQPTR
jgi:TPR repeat protein